MNQVFLDGLYEIVKSNIGDSSFGAKELSKELGMSHSSLFRKVRSLTGKSINQLIKEIRLKSALEALMEEDVSVSEVAFRYGFSSPSYFTVCFKKFYGYLPGEVNKTNGNGPVNNEADGPKSEKKKRTVQISIFSVLLLAIIATVLFTIPGIINNKSTEAKSIAILPFKYLGDDSTKQYKADGMRLAIQQKLGEIRDLRVIPYTTMEQYRNSGKTIKAIGRELKVDYIMEGFLQLEGENHNHIINLNNVTKEKQVFSKNYTQDLDDVFSVQNQAIKDIVDEIKIIVTPEENITIEKPPTLDLTAYEFYLLGNEYAKNIYFSQERQLAIEMYEKAIQKDSNFVLAYVGLAAGFRYNYRQKNYSASRLVDLHLTKKYLDKAKSLSPNLKEVRFEEALYYYQCKLDYPKALEMLQGMKTEYPNDAEIFAWIGYIYGKTEEYEKSIEYKKHAISLNPSYWEYWNSIAYILRYQRLPESKNTEYYYLKSMELLGPSGGMANNISNYYYEIGELDKAIEIIRTHEDLINPNWAKFCYAYNEYVNRNFNKAIRITNSISEEEPLDLFFTKHRLLGYVYLCIPDSAKAKYHFGLDLDFLLKKIKEAPDHYRLYSALRSAFAGLGMKDQALEADRKVKDILEDLPKNSLRFVYYNTINRIVDLVVLGEYDLAMEELDSIMKQYSHIYIEFLKYHPSLDPVRKHKKFQEIISNPEYQLNF